MSYRPWSARVIDPVQNRVTFLWTIILPLINQVENSFFCLESVTFQLGLHARMLSPQPAQSLKTVTFITPSTPRPTTFALYPQPTTPRPTTPSTHNLSELHLN